MANVTKYLEQLLVARYGKDVRQALHDSIKEINEEVTDYGTTASQKAEEAAQSASDASQKASDASTAATTASQKATEATNAASEALQSANDAKDALNSVGEKVDEYIANETNLVTDANVNTKINAYLVENGVSDNWAKNMCPNIYVQSNGSTQASGATRDFNNTITVLKSLGVKQVSLLAMIATYENNTFALSTNVNYQTVVDAIHDADMTITSVRFANSAYGKENMCDATKIADLATSIPTIMSNLGIADEVEFVGILNETSQAYFDSTLTDAIVSCIKSLQTSGYKVAITDNARMCMQIPDAILEVLDYIGFNEYPLLCAFEGKATADSISKAFDSYQIAMYADKLKAKGLKVYISEVGCCNQTNALSAPASGSTGDYNGMTNILLEFKGFKKYLSDSNLGNLIESFNPWYAEIWESTDEMIELFGGAK